MSIFNKKNTTELPNTSENTNEKNAEMPFSPAVSREEFVNAALNNIEQTAKDTQSKPTPVSTNISEDDFDDFDDFGFTENIDNSVSAQQTSEVSDDATENKETSKEKKNKKEKLSTEEKRRKRRLALRRFKRKFRKVISAIKTTIILLVLICSGIYIYSCATLPVNKISRNVYIENVNVSNMTAAEALNAVNDAGILSTQTLSLVCNEHVYTINGSDVGLSAKLEDTVNKAMLYGKTDNVFLDSFTNALQLFSRHTVIPTAKVNEESIRTKLTEFGEQVHGKLIEHKYELGDGVVVAIPGRTGFNGDTTAAYNEVIHAIQNEKFTNISVTLSSGPPAPPSVEDAEKFAYLAPVDAVYKYDKNTVTVADDIPGRYIKTDEAQTLLSQLKEGGESINIPYYPSQATVTKAILTEKLFNSTLASYSTKYAGSTSNRCANVANAASRINNKVLAPGEVFSFNNTVGRRSVANGFYTAKEYVDGQTVDGIGGGTCQVSSTLYNAVLYSDLSVVSRLNHMFPVDYCPLGQDATVSDSGVDFKFVNNTAYPIKISATTAEYVVTVNIIGTARDVPVKVEIENIKKAVGEDTSVRSYRYVYDPSGKLLRKDDLGTSYYMAH